jgi:hypothetical protein
MFDFAIAALAHEHIRDLQQEAVRARLAREAGAARRSVRTGRGPSLAIGTGLSHLLAGFSTRRASAQPCCVA